MRRYILAATLAAASAVAQDDPFLKGAELQAEIARSCADGCITFNRQEAETLKDEFDRILTEKQKQAFAAGVQAQRQACASLVSR